ncbi:MAG: alkaline phosphatase family protein [Acidobacteria bacterium]|nr:alkaline phosphatase family protein [Acidobacteriota bacterium]
MSLSRSGVGRALVAAATLLTTIALGAPTPAATARADQGLNANEIPAAAEIVGLLTGRSLDGTAVTDPKPWADQTVDMVVALRDGAYYAYAKRGAVRFTRAPSGAGWAFTAEILDGKNPLADQDGTALHSLAEELAAREDDTVPPGCDPETDRDCRFFVGAGAVTYPNAYERIAAAFDSSRTGDIAIIPWNDGPASSAGEHGHLGVVQSRATLIVSGRGARRSPLPVEEEAALGVQNVDIAPTVAEALGVRPYFMDAREPARTLGGEPSTTALLRRQDGEVQTPLLEEPLNVFAVVVDGLEPEDISKTFTPNLWSLAESGRARRYLEGRANMVAETNANHAAMMTGAYGEVSGMVANAFYDQRAKAKRSLESPSLIRAETLFDAIERQKPGLKTAAVMGKEKLKRLFDCTRPAPSGPCGESTDNPEGVPVAHVRPDFLIGASTSFDPEEAPGEPATGSGYSLDTQIMDLAIELQGREDPDFTFVNLGLVDGIQHLFGAESPQGRAAVRGADLQIGRLVDYLKGAGKWQHSVVMVLADHSFQSTGDAVSAEVAGSEIGVENPATPHLSGGWIVLPDVLGTCPATSFTTVSHGGAASVYLTDPGYDPYAGTSLTTEQQDCLKTLRARALANTGVDEAMYRIPVSGDSAPIHPEWRLDSPRAGELLLTAKDANAFLDSRTSSAAAITGNHGGPSTRHIPFLVASGGTFLNGGSDGSNLARPIDIAPTAAWLLGVNPPDRSEGRVLTEAFSSHPSEAIYGEPRANRAAIFIFDANNSVDVHTLLAATDPTTGAAFTPCQQPPDPDDPVPNLRCLAAGGLVAEYGATAAWPSVTFPNHNTIGSGAYPGHHGIVNNSWYERETQRSESPIGATDPQNPVYFYTESLLSKDVETLHEAVHRTFGDWMGPDNHDPTKGDGAFTASVDEPSARGADFASLEQTNRLGEPAVAMNWARADELAADTTAECLEKNPEAYGVGTSLDHIGQGQARSLYQDPSHPAPKYLINNFALTDEAAHAFGPHTTCTLAAYRDADRRLGRVLGAMADAGVLGETLIVVTGDHGMESQRSSAGAPSVASELEKLGYRFVKEGAFVYLLSLDVSVSPDAFSSGQQVTVTVDVRDDDTGDPLGGAFVTVDSGGSTSGTTPEASAPERTTIPYPREISDALDAAEDLAGPDLGDHPTIENPVRAYTDSSGRVSLTFTPSAGQVTITVHRDGFNDRTLVFTAS